MRAGLARVALLLLLLAPFASVASSAANSEGAADARSVLALFDGSREAKVRWTRVHRYAEMVLNHLGFQVAYHDLSEGPPPLTLDAGYAAVLTWFDAPVPDSASYAQWAGEVGSVTGGIDGLPFVVLGETGLAQADLGGKPAQAFLDRLGLAMQPQEHYFGLWARVAAHDPELIGFERDYTVAQARFPLIRAGAGAVSHLRVSEPETVGGAATDLVVTAPTGAFAHASALLRYDSDTETSLWMLNPFRFFEQLLGGGPRPIPDTTTLNGRRLFFAVVNGEGWATPLPADRPGEPVRLAGSVVLEKLLEPHPELPLTLAVVTGDFDPSLGGLFAPTARESAAAALRLRNVEPASRTRTMPLRWSFFERYMRDAEMDAVERLVSGTPLRDRGLLPAAFSNLSEVFVKDRGSLASGRGSALRRYVAEPFDLNAEIGGALLEAAALAGTDEPIRLVTWSGDAQVFEAALASARSSGATAMGGEGGLYDSVAPSVSNLSALSVQVGAERQIYDALCGDAVLTNYWTTPIHGLLRLERVIDATERPRRLKPVQLSFSAYSALRYGSLTAVQTLLDRVGAMDLAPVYAADYARIVEGFSTMRSILVGPLQWRIEDRGALQTLRFDAPVGTDLDPARCSGVLGRRAANDSLYVALDPAVEQPVVALSLAGGEADKRPEADSFLLDNARWRISGLDADSCSATFDAAGFGTGDMTWQVPVAGTYQVELFRGGSGIEDAPLFWDDVAVGEDRRLVLTLPPMEDGVARVRLSACR